MFSLQGRLKRAAFIGWSVAILIIYAAVITALFRVHLIPIAAVIGTLGFVWYLAVTVGLVVRRLHDIGLSGWWGWVFPGLLLAASKTVGTPFSDPIKFVLLASLVAIAAWPSEYANNRYGYSDDLEPVY